MSSEEESRREVVKVRRFNMDIDYKHGVVNIYYYGE